jgi:hypothetical protein
MSLQSLKIKMGYFKFTTHLFKKHSGKHKGKSGIENMLREKITKKKTKKKN